MDTTTTVSCVVLTRHTSEGKCFLKPINQYRLQYFPIVIHTVHGLLCFVVVCIIIIGLFCPYPHYRFRHWRMGNDAISRLVCRLRHWQNGRHFADDTFKRIFMNENVRFSINISLKFVHKGLIKQYPSIGSDNGLAPTRRQTIIWTNDGQFTDAYMGHLASMS